MTRTKFSRFLVNSYQHCRFIFLAEMSELLLPRKFSCQNSWITEFTRFIYTQLAVWFQDHISFQPASSYNSPERLSFPIRGNAGVSLIVSTKKVSVVERILRADPLHGLCILNHQLRKIPFHKTAKLQSPQTYLNTSFKAAFAPLQLQ